jgi:prepilin signal peptidase PulO-like enzyme (type II secretory pathway)
MMKLMFIVVLVLLGLCFGSFVNALVWRLHEQTKPKKKRALSDKDLSIVHGRSRCVHCKHVLAAADLVPVISWLWLRGRCRYCGRKIDDRPWVELLLPVLFVVSYVYWPYTFDASGWTAFVVWLVLVTGLLALMVYDIRWMLLPNRIVYPLIGLAGVHVLVQALVFGGGLELIGWAILAAAIAGGVFYALWLINDGWIGGGDAKLGYILGLAVATPSKSFLILFGSSLLGLLYSLPLILTHRLNTKSRVPYGPFLIAATFIAQLWGDALVHWYTGLFFG